MNKILQHINKLFYKEKPIPNLTQDQAYGLLSQLYQNDAFRKYLDARERYLVDNGMNMFIMKRDVQADRIAGQLMEVRTMRARIKSAYLIMNNLHKSKKTLNKEQDKS